jgi:hypothetical protein
MFDNLLIIIAFFKIIFKDFINYKNGNKGNERNIVAINSQNNNELINLKSNRLT